MEEVCKKKIIELCRCEPDRYIHFLLLARGKERYLQRGVPPFSLHTCDRASHNQAVPSDAAVPLWSDSLELDILEPSLLEPLDVLFFLGEEHPHVGEEAGQPEGRVHGANQTSHPTHPQDPVGLLDSPLRIRPVLNAAR